ncbi:MAG: RDD family protein [Candidatus Competibacterales bacterium]
MSSNPYQTPQADLGQPELPRARPLASRTSRLVAAILDALAGILFAIPIAIAVGVLEALGTLDPNTLNLVVGGGGVLALLALMMVQGYLLHRRGQTLGKMAMAVQIVSAENYRRVSLWRIVGLRVLPINLISPIPVVGPVAILVDALFIFRDDRRCLHDLIAGTAVVEYRP